MDKKGGDKMEGLKPYYEENLVTIYNSDALEALRVMRDESVQMAITSPPY